MKKSNNNNNNRNNNRSKNSKNTPKKCVKGGTKRGNSRGNKDNFLHEEQDTDGNNDVSWYAANDAILRDSASIPFSWATGTKVRLDNPITKNETITIPGVMVITLKPAFGFSDNPNSPVNIATKAVYTWVRHQNSGSKNYDAPDLMLYICAMTEVYSYINYLQRLYSICTMYSTRNRYTPEALVRANGADFSSIMSNLANFRFQINVLIKKAGSLCAPSNMTIFNRRAFLYQYLYTEGTSMKDQMYMYVPNSFLVYDETMPGEGGRLKEVPFFSVSSPKTVEQLIAFGNNMLDPIIASEDMNIMSGDILKAYGESGLIKLAPMESDPSFAPVFNIGVLEQMKNATLVGANLSSVDLHQDETKGYLISAPSFPLVTGYNQTVYEAYTENRILTTTTADVTPGLVMESTRLMAGVRKVQKNTSTGVVEQYQIVCGSELAVNARVWFFKEDGTLDSVVYESQQVLDISKQSDAANNVKQTADILSKISAFKFAPFYHYYVKSVPETPPTGDYFVYDFDNYAVITTEDLDRMHEAALLNEFHVPSVGVI